MIGNPIPCKNSVCPVKYAIYSPRVSQFVTGQYPYPEYSSIGRVHDTESAAKLYLKKTKKSVAKYQAWAHEVHHNAFDKYLSYNTDDWGIVIVGMIIVATI